MKGAMDNKAKKFWRVVGFLVSLACVTIVFVIILMAVLDSSSMTKIVKISGEGKINKAQAKKRSVDEVEALVTCRNAYRQYAKYDSKIGFLSPYKQFKTKDSWIFKLEGKLQNVFGAWERVRCHCEVPFEPEFESRHDLRNIKVFEYMPLF